MLLASLLIDEPTSSGRYLDLTLQHVSNQKFKIGEKDWLKHVMSRSFVTKNVGFKKKIFAKAEIAR